MTFAAFVAPADSFLVYGNGRLQVFDSTGSYAREVRMRAALPIGVSFDSSMFTYVSRARRFGNDSTGVFVVRLRAHGAPLDSFRIFAPATVVELIDPDRGVLLARLELPFLGVRVAQGYIGRITMDAIGHYVTTVHRLRFTR